MYEIVETIAKIVRSVVRFINKIIKALNKLPGVSIKKLREPNTDFKRVNLVQRIDERIGMLLLSDDITGVPKKLLITGSGDNVKISAVAKTLFSAESKYNLYYYIDNLTPSNDGRLGNQYYIYKMEKVPFCVDDLNTIRGADTGDGTAKILSPEGNPARLISVDWKLWDNIADIVYWEQKLYSDNLRIVERILEGEIWARFSAVITSSEELITLST